MHQTLTSSGVETGGSGGAMNLGPWAPGASSNGATKNLGSLLLICRPREVERLSWLAYSGRFTHKNGYPSAAGPVQARESSPVRDQRSTTELDQ